MARTKKQPATAKWQVVGVVPGVIVFLDRQWDLRTISAKDAKFLMQNGCPYIKATEAIE